MQAAQNDDMPLSQPIQGTSESHVYVPKGTIIAIPVNVVQEDPTVWGQDAAEFKPERWMEINKKTEAGHNKQHQLELLAFSRGPRKCLGRVFADAEIKVRSRFLVRPSC